MEKMTPEKIVLRYSKRGMDQLEKYMIPGYCRRAAEKLLHTRRGTVLVTTGFYVGGYAETDGPLGTVAVALALEKLGFHPVIVTDQYCKGFFELKDLEVEYVPIGSGDDIYDEILTKYHPVYLISIERCGKDASRQYRNMRGISITEKTAGLDRLFELAEKKKIPTIGVGDGGNEIGMGNLQDMISRDLNIKPCVVPVDDLVIATTSNWGAYAIVAYLQILSGEEVLVSFAEIEKYLREIIAIGSVDGVTGKKEMRVDGFDMIIEKEILDSLAENSQNERNLLNYLK